MLKSFFGQTMEAGCDEAGRGPLAGPVVAAAVIFPRDFTHPLLNDSKKLTPAQRKFLEPIILAEAVAVGVAQASAQEIDEINILQATFLAMHRAIEKVIEQGPRPELLLIDGNRFNAFPNIPHHCVVQGDATFASIAAASILAKNERDRQMHALAKEYHGYGWETNVGYPTRSHREAIRKYGLTPLHRKTFAEKFLT
ncbi:MAG: ribonuclease HII [Bacteroidota bacterium]